MHASHVELAAERNLSIFLEKPISLTLGDADRIVSIVNRRHAKCMLGFNRRSDVSYGKAKLDIIKGKIGKPILVKTCARDPKPPADEYIKHSGGIFVDECIHDFDVALWLMNKRIKRVSAIGRTLMYPQFAKYGDYDNAVAILEFRDGELGIIEGSRTSKYGYDLRTEVLGTTGSVNIDNWRDDSTRVFTSKGSVSEPGSWFLERFADSYRCELDRFYSYIRKGSASPISAEDGREALRVALASTEAAKKGHPVTLTN
jgi:scyllo-inositol 2-dehydrogenase (NAD+)